MSKVLLTAQELKERIDYNDNRATAQPYLLLLRRKRQVVVDGDYGGEIKWVENITGNYMQMDTKEELIDYLRNDYYEDEDWEPDFSDITKVYIDEIDEVSNVFLTDKGYQEHLDANKHNLGKHDTYGIHAFRNKEIESLYALVDKCAELEKQVELLKEHMWISTNQLRGVSKAIAVHGTNIDTQFFIETYEKMAKDKEAVLEQIKGKDE